MYSFVHSFVVVDVVVDQFDMIKLTKVSLVS